MNAYEVLGIEYAVFILTRRVNYLRREILTAVLDDFAERILDSGIVAVHEVSIHELHCERGFANRAAANNGHLALLWRGRHSDKGLLLVLNILQNGKRLGLWEARIWFGRLREKLSKEFNSKLNRGANFVSTPRI